MIDTGRSGHRGVQFSQRQGNEGVKEVVRDPAIEDSRGTSLVDAGDDGAGDGGLSSFSFTIRGCKEYYLPRHLR